MKQHSIAEAVLIYSLERRSTPQCHASTIVDTDHGVAAAWFGGRREGHPGVGIWFARRVDGVWRAPREVADGLTGNVQYPCWNPVLHRRADETLLLFYLVGPSPREWWSLYITSGDGGESWSDPERLPSGIFGPIKNKPLVLTDGTLLCPTSDEAGGWRVYMTLMESGGDAWSRVGPLNRLEEFEAIQPTLLTHADGSLQALCRTRQGVIAEIRSRDGGRSWSPMAATELPNPNSGIDGLTLSDGRHLLVYNHTARGRSPLNLAVSEDGTGWRQALALETEPGEFSYPAVIQSPDGNVHITYTWQRRSIKHVVLSPDAL